MKILHILEIVIINIAAIVSACQYCGLYKYGAVYEKDIVEFGEYRG